MALTTPTPAKLPLWATVEDAYRLTWANRVEYFKIARWWILIVLPVFYVSTSLEWSFNNPACITLVKKPAADVPFYVTILALLRWATMAIAGASVAVAFHRLILRNERVATHRYLRADGLVWEYFWYGVFISFLSWIPGIIGSMIAIHEVPPLFIGTVAVISFIMMLITIVMSMRLMLILPAKALQAHEVTLKEVLKRTRWNFWRLFIGLMLCFAPALVGGFFAAFSQFFCSNDLLSIVLGITITQLPYVFICTPITITFLSLSYRHFFENPEAAANALPAS